MCSDLLAVTFYVPALGQIQECSSGVKQELLASTEIEKPVSVHALALRGY